MARVSLSTIVVAHDSLTELCRSLPPLVAQLQPGDDLIVVDNASRDGLAAQLASLAPQARLIALTENVGFAGGADRGAAAASGDLLVLLNPDAVVQPGWSEAIRAPWGQDWAAWMALVLLVGGAEINTSGGVLHFTGVGWAGQVGEPAAAAPAGPEPVGFLSGACLAIPRTSWEAVGGFSEHFFMYCEDVDLSLKLRLEGGTLAVVPDARVAHEYEFAKGGQKWRLLERNRWATMTRNYPTRLLVLVMPALLAAELAVWAMALRGGWGQMKALATLDYARALPRLLRERREIQDRRQVSVAEFAGALTPDLSSPYFGAIGRQPVVRAMLRLYWRLVLALLD
jgi:N-acetylglucosaminyl-diphospho-decaprenol L-rhamnosyltransferase